MSNQQKLKNLKSNVKKSAQGQVSGSNGTWGSQLFGGLKQLRKADPGIFTNTNPTQGYQVYNLDTVVQNMYPVYVPMLKLIPRTSGEAGSAYNFKQVRNPDLNNSLPYMAEGSRGTFNAIQVFDATVPFASLVQEGFATWQVGLASRGLTPEARQQRVISTIDSFMLKEHKQIMVGNRTLFLGTTPAPSLSVGAAGTLTGTISVIALALTHLAVEAYNSTGSIPTTITQAQADGTSLVVNGGAAIKSANATLAVTDTNINAQVVAVPGAVGYAWFWGAAGSEVLGAVTSNNALVISAAATGSQTPAAFTVDRSADGLGYDGLITQISQPSSGSIVLNINGSDLTPTGAGGFAEFDDILKQLAAKQKLSPQQIHVNGNTYAKLSTLLLSNGSTNTAARIILERDATGGTLAGNQVVQYKNPVMGTPIELVFNPDVPEGMALFYTDKIPYANVQARMPVEMVMGSDYFMQEWPMRTNKYEFSVQTYGALVCRYLPGMALLTGINYAG